MSPWSWPLPILVPLLLVGMLVAHECGLRIHARLRGRADRPDSGSGDEGFILSGVLGLLALLMAFSFSMALSRFENRRDLMLSETSALGNLAMMADVPAIHANEIKGALTRYAQARLSAVQRADGADRHAAERVASALRDPLSDAVRTAIRAEAGKPTAVALASAFDEVEDTAVRRNAMAGAHLPDRVLWLLAIYSIISAAMMGYAVAGNQARHRTASSTFYLLLSLAFAVMLDLDRPRSGTIVISQEPFERAVRALPTGR